MADIYQTIQEQGKSDFVPDAEFDKQAWSAKKQEERSAIFEKIDQACTAINEDPEKLGQYLSVMARFPNHSVSNTLLVFDQNPEATRIGDSNYWSSKGAAIKKGERALTILEPGNEYIRDDGSVGQFYDNKKVFDVAQTTAKNRRPRNYDAQEVLVALVSKSPVTIKIAESTLNENAGYDHSEGVIHVKKGLSTEELFEALSTELAHASFARGEEAYERSANHGRAQLTAITLGCRYGIEIPNPDMPELAPKDSTPQEIKGVLTSVRNAIKDIGDRAAAALDKPKARTREAR